MRPASRSPAFVAFLGIALIMGCGDTACACDLEPLERDLDDADKVYDGVLIEVSESAFGFLERNVDAIIDTFLPDGLSYNLPPTPNVCPESCNAQYICAGSTPCAVSAELDRTRLMRRSPHTLRFQSDLYVHSGNVATGPAEPIPVRICQPGVWPVECISVACDVRIHVTQKPVALEVVFDRDPVTDALTFRLSDPEIEVEETDFTISGGGNLGEQAICLGAEVFLKGFITNMINDMLAEQVVGQVEATIDEMTCMPCDYYTEGCRVGTGVTGVYCGSSTGWCMRGTDQCVRAPLGFVGMVDIADLLPIGLPSFTLAGHAGVGQRVGPFGDPFIPFDEGPLRLRGIGGAAADHSSHCVPPPSTMPRTDPPPRVDFSHEAGNSDYHVGIGISDRFLNKVLYEVYRGGGLCMNIGSELSEMVSTAILTTFLPSLRVLTEGQTRPMYIALRPKDRPEIHVGEGTYRVEGGETVLDEPLLRLVMNNLYLDFYAFFEERYYRLFSLDVDLVLPLGLEVNHANEVIPVIGRLDQLVDRLVVTNNEILAEDPTVLQEIIPVLISLVEPMLGAVMDPIPIPEVQGFRLKDISMHGMVPHETQGRYEHLGLLAELDLVRSKSSSAKHQHATVELLEVRRPSSSERQRAEPDKPLPRASLLVEVESLHGDPVEWQYRINDGFWSPFQQADLLEISSPKLALQGRHVLEVRARRLGEPSTLNPNAFRFEVLLDWDPPTARLDVDPATGVARVHARDTVTSTSLLEYSFAVDGGSFGPYGRSNEIQLPMDATLLEVRVRDEASNVTEVSWRGLAVDPARKQGSKASVLDSAGGCVVGPSGPRGAAFAIAVLLGLLMAIGLFSTKSTKGQEKRARRPSSDSI